MPRLRPALPLLLALLAALGPAAAQTAARAAPPIATDRPGFAFSPVVVPVGAFQVEAGLPFATRATAGGATTTIVGLPTGLRYGLTPRLELRANAALYNTRTTDVDAGPDPARVDGVGDVEVGIKVQVLASDGASPSLTLLPSVVLPIGRSDFSAGDPVLGLSAAAGFALPQGLGATLVAGVSVPTADGAQATGTAVALLGRALTPALSGYVEAAAFPTDGATPLYAGAGLACLLSPTVQIDAALDVGLNAAAADVLGGLGLSIRFGR